jgi:hypothetical protein
MALDCTLVDIDSRFNTSVQGTYFYQVIFDTKSKFLENQAPLGFTILTEHHQFCWNQGIMPWHMYRFVDLQYLLITNKLYLKKWKGKWLVDFLKMSFPEKIVAKEQKFHGRVKQTNMVLHI